ncbi:MAG: hypothetical protein MMC23_005592 [Stictis urceolatum]|nr:hypothetical protein [Stictis urceolata]
MSPQNGDEKRGDWSDGGTFTVLYFAAASSFTRKSTEALPAPLDVKDLFKVLEERYVGIRAKVLNSCLVTVNLEYVDIGGMMQSKNEVIGGRAQVIIQPGDEVAIIPPVSSG